MKCSELFHKIDALNDKYISVWEDVCNIESPTNYKIGVDKVGEYFIKMAEERNWQIEVFEEVKAGNAICITMNPDVKAEPVIFSGHIDTVHPIGSFGNPPVKFDKEKIYGPGVTDCKGGVVASFLAMDALRLCGFKNRPVKLIIQTDEETSSINSDKKTVEFMCEKSKGSIAFLNTEGPYGNIAVLERKGIVRYKFTIFGIAAHSARCTDGSNAITEAAYKIIKLEQFKDLEGLTSNCGVINGGTTPNTVAESCSFFVDIRFADLKQYELAQKTVMEVANTSFVEGCRCEVEKVSYRPAMVYSKQNYDLLDKINQIYFQNGIPKLTAIKGHGGSDASYITDAGIPCVDSIGIPCSMCKTYCYGCILYIIILLFKYYY